jgi:hypothetical protein
MIGFGKSLELCQKGFQARMLGTHKSPYNLSPGYVGMDVKLAHEIRIQTHKPSRGRYVSFWASVPNSFIGCMTNDDWTEAIER